MEGIDGLGALSCEPPMPPCAQSDLQNPYSIVYLFLDPEVVAAFSAPTPPFSVIAHVRRKAVTEDCDVA